MDLDLVWGLLLAAGVAYLMMAAGLSKHALEWKRRARICPSCHRDTRDCSCRS